MERNRFELSNFGQFPTSSSDIGVFTAAGVKASVIVVVSSTFHGVDNCRRDTLSARRAAPFQLQDDLTVTEYSHSTCRLTNDDGRGLGMGRNCGSYLMPRA